MNASAKKNSQVSLPIQRPSEMATGIKSLVIQKPMGEPELTESEVIFEENTLLMTKEKEPKQVLANESNQNAPREKRSATDLKLTHMVRVFNNQPNVEAIRKTTFSNFTKQSQTMQSHSPGLRPQENKKSAINIGIPTPRLSSQRVYLEYLPSNIDINNNLLVENHCIHHMKLMGRTKVRVGVGFHGSRRSSADFSYFNGSTSMVKNEILGAPHTEGLEFVSFDRTSKMTLVSRILDSEAYFQQIMPESSKISLIQVQHMLFQFLDDLSRDCLDEKTFTKNLFGIKSTYEFEGKSNHNPRPRNRMVDHAF